ncbi:hypothetical protein [Chelatococcus asaccharovorans]|uniref:hypothetical protein n=1 Tax=Chelatococcus asaccharovorans TaxID=28210 RepID=UPI00224C6432|nr:hypothetical protein [Chelatococcus asaccharovorans]CAH1670156.1 conserved hypothetical protein [Chelatococcus asaccharovorans]CAH1678376.1 conserved hypothetical protein [Chelatococcus asaccharovorans]
MEFVEGGRAPERGMGPSCDESIVMPARVFAVTSAVLVALLATPALAQSRSSDRIASTRQQTPTENWTKPARSEKDIAARYADWDRKARDSTSGICVGCDTPAPMNTQRKPKKSKR